MSFYLHVIYVPAISDNILLLHFWDRSASGRGETGQQDGLVKWLQFTQYLMSLWAAQHRQLPIANNNHNHSHSLAVWHAAVSRCVDTGRRCEARANV